jgi:hypothetical protein
MTAFVAALGLLTANDALAGRVDGERILSHSLILAAYALLLVMNLPRLRDTPPPARLERTGGGPWSLGGGAAGNDAGNDGDNGPTATVYPFPARASATIPVQPKRRRSA